MKKWIYQLLIFCVYVPPNQEKKNTPGIRVIQKQVVSDRTLFLTYRVQFLCADEQRCFSGKQTEMSAQGWVRVGAGWLPDVPGV